MFFPALDAVVIDLRLRFGEEQKRAAKLGMLIPANMTSDWEKDFKPLQQDVLDLYLDLLTEPIATVKAEYKLWHLHWSNAEKKTTNCPDSLRCLQHQFSGNFFTTADYGHVALYHRPSRTNIFQNGKDNNRYQKQHE